MKSVEVIIGAGVDDNIDYISGETKLWSETYGINITPYKFGFSNKQSTDFAQCYNELLEVVDATNAIAIIGISGFGSVAINVLHDRINQIEKVVNICGRLRRGGISAVPLRWSEKKYPLFFESLNRCESIQSRVDPKKVMTMRPRFDEVVPPNTVTLKGATNIKLALPVLREWLLNPNFLHTYYSRFALRDYCDVIVKFIKPQGINSNQ